MDKMSSEQVPEDVPRGADDGVSTSRRRFTRAGLTASAILTLASRSALGGPSCSVSGTLSGDTSTPGRVACIGHLPSYYHHEQNWPPGFFPGLRNPLAEIVDNGNGALVMRPASRLDYSYPPYEAVENAINVLRGDAKARCVEYREWAWPTWAVAPTAVPHPSPPPSRFDDEFASAALSALDTELTLMQALTEYEDDIPGHAVAALFNAYTIGPEQFGYTPPGLKQFIRECDPGQLLAHLRMLNSR